MERAIHVTYNYIRNPTQTDIREYHNITFVIHTLQNDSINWIADNQ